MKLIAEGVWQLAGFPRDMFNVYLAGDVLIDAATRWAKRRILRQLQGRTVRMVALTLTQAASSLPGQFYDTIPRFSETVQYEVDAVFHEPYLGFVLLASCLVIAHPLLGHVDRVVVDFLQFR